MLANNNSLSKRVAVIVVLWKSRRFLDAWFDTMSRLDYPRELVEIVFVDNASADGSREYVDEMMLNPLPGLPKMHYMPQSLNLGYAGGNNAGIKYAVAEGFDYVYLINYDIRVEPDFLAEAVMAAESSEKIGSVQSLLRLWPEKDLINSSGNMVHFLGFGFCGDGRVPISQKHFIGLPEIAYPSGAGVLFKASILREVGLFDEKFFAYHEDLDLGWR
ncbi:glycosyltransferase family 2 protein, partial [Patescibacteria group bacterium]|nr:glycosyltransferase family 2 protein [Patescibacteria group bacterium]MBU1921770.1 glycosyltransferase family 2 protein [Patescibacteria group bacterium]